METLEIWEFTDHHPSGKDVLYQLERRGGELSIHSDDPEFGKRLADCSGDQVLIFLKYLVTSGGEKCDKTIIESNLWKTTKHPGIVDTYLTKLRNLLNDDRRSNRGGDVLGGRIIQSLKGGYLCFTPEVVHTPSARIQKTTLLDPFSSVPPKLHYVERPESSEPLVAELCSGSDRPVGVTGITGMGGVGKTTLALALCHDLRIRKAFPDGIFWFKIGNELDVRFNEYVKNISLALNRTFDVDSPEAYRTVLSGKAILIVLDNVWAVAQVEPFLLSSGRSRLLYTSRDKSLAGPLAAHNHEIGLLTEDQARLALGRWSGRESMLPEPHASEILSACGGLALALGMIGGSLKGKLDGRWSEIGSDLRRGRLKSVRARPAGYQYETLHAAIAASVDALDVEPRKCYLKLATLLKDMPAPLSVLQVLWGIKDERVLREIIDLLVDRSLLREDSEGLVLHDVQLDFVRGEYADQDALSLQRSALLLSSHVIRTYPEQFASQMIGRLKVYESNPSIAQFLDDLVNSAPRPFLQPVSSTLVAAGGALKRVLQSPYDVLNLTLSANGRYAITAAHDTAFRIWDLDGNTLPRVVSCYPSTIWSVTSIPNSARVVLQCDDGLRVWDLDHERTIKLVKCRGRNMRSIAVTADGRRAVSASHENRHVRVWDLEGEEPRRVLRGHEGWVCAVAITARGDRVVSSSFDNTLRVWNLEADEPPRILPGHSDVVLSVAMTPDGKRAVSSGADKTLRVWDLDSNEPPRVLRGFECNTGCLAITPDGRRVVGADGTIFVWDLNNLEPPRRLHGSEERIYGVVVTEDGRSAISASGKTLQVWNLDVRPESPLQSGHSAAIWVIGVTGKGRVISGSDDETLRLWDVDLTRPVRLVAEKVGGPPIALSADATRAIAFSTDRKFKIWDIDSGQLVSTLSLGSYNSNEDYPQAVALTADCKRAVACDYFNGLWCWNISGSPEPRRIKARKLRPFKGLIIDTSHSAHSRAVAVTADGSRAVSGSASNTFVVWDLEGDRMPRVIQGYIDPARDDRNPNNFNIASIGMCQLALTHDGKYAVAGSSDTLQILDLEGEQPPRVLSGHKALISALALSPDGIRMISASFDKTIRIWDLTTCRCITAFTSEEVMFCCAWSHSRIVGGDRRGQLHVFALNE